ncbi:P-loop containing nucleoside triphosphate hydrolase protein [Fusarium avenaceum]|nr:P-loop containing nucleoside triphosphate hydrolase protein [Fusarium avenaceum]
MINNKKGNFLSDPELLARIDKLRDLNIGKHVPLPQLVVVGDQSSGKSSLLESLTGIPFPKDQTLCTRHATQITCCRGKSDYINVCIVAGPYATDQHKQDVEAFHVPVSSRAEIQNDFAGILRKANEKMGLRADITDGNGAVFSEDVLKIEIHGPDEDYLTIIDVPGIFRATTQGTTKEDMVIVNELVKGYIRNDRTVILAVLPSNVDVATQEILELAEDYDKDGVRTLGVLTKPDLVTEPEGQDAVCDLINGKKRPLNLGYFLVRNKGPKSTLDDQSKLDRIFLTQPWVDLPQDRVGIPALKEELRRLLSQVAEREYPKLLQDVNNKIRKCKKDLDNLGPPRQDERQQRSFLSHIAEAFQDRVRAALAADYNADPVFDQTELRLITQVVNITDLFNEEFQQKAHSRHFYTPGLFEPISNDFIFTVAADYTSGEIAEIGDLVIHGYAISPPSEDVMTWIKDIYAQTRGLDLGTFNPNLVAMAFSAQSRKWGCMTKLYMSKVVITLHRFIASALRSVCQEEHVRLHIWSSIQNDLHERYKRALEQADLLIEVERHKKPYTLNRQFSEALSKSRGRRITELLQPRARKDNTQYGETQYMVNLADIAKAAEYKSNSEHLQEEIHDILHAYYQLALDRFVDNVFQLAVDYSLLHGPHSPLRVFTQEWVINLESGDLGRIAGEAKSTKKSRSKLIKKIDELSGAVKILNE